MQSVRQLMRHQMYCEGPIYSPYNGLKQTVQYPVQLRNINYSTTYLSSTPLEGRNEEPGPVLSLLSLH